MERKNYRQMGISPSSVTYTEMTGEERPEEVEVGVNMAQEQRSLNVEVSEREEGGYGWLRITLPVGVWDYGSIVSALVRSKYSEDEVEAIISNNIALIATPSAVSDEEGQEKLSEFQQFQEWREQCKQRAKELMSSFEAPSSVGSSSSAASSE